LSGTVSDADSGVEAVYVSLDGASFGEAAVSYGGWSTNMTVAGDGNHTNYAYAMDKAGNVSATNSIRVVRASIPSIVINGLIDNCATNISSIDLAGIVSIDAPYSIIDFGISINGSGYLPLNTNNTSWLTNGITLNPNQTNTIRLKAIGSNAKIYETPVYHIIMDNTAPSINLTALPVYTNKNTFTVSAPVTENLTGIVYLKYQVDSGSYKNYTGNSFVVSNLSEGLHTITVLAADSADNLGSSNCSTTVDITPPSINISSPGNGDLILNNAATTLTGTASDSFSGIKETYFSLNSGPYNLATGTSNWSNSMNFNPGSNNIKAYCMDQAGNNSQTNQIYLSLVWVTTIAGTGTAGTNDGISNVATFNTPTGIIFDQTGNLYVADNSNNKIRKISLTGIVSTVAGDGTPGNIDGPSNTATFNSPYGMVFDNIGNLYVAEQANHKIRKITPLGMVTTFAGIGTTGTNDGISNIAKFNMPKQMVSDQAGNIFVSEGGNNKIRKITPAGIVSTFAGSGVSGTNDGVSNVAMFRAPSGIDFDSAGNLFVADNLNHKIRKITPAGIVSTFAGSGIAGTNDGIGENATFNTPTGLVIDYADNIYVSDCFSYIIRRITPDRSVKTIAGTALIGSADGAGTNSSFNNPRGLTVDSAGNIYVADGPNNKIRKIIIK
jgi:sugar lactone lactonase YvrE